MKRSLLLGLIISIALSACATSNGVTKNTELTKKTVRIATFNVSVEATNYLSRTEIAANPNRASVVQQLLASGDHSQIKNIAEIIQRVRPDVLLLNEFDYIADPKQGIELFVKNYLAISQSGQASIDYPYYYIAPVNTGVPTPFDLNNDGKKSGSANDAFGFGLYPGQYGMAVLSRYPINKDQVNTLQQFLWKDMPNAMLPFDDNGEPWYSAEEWAQFRLSSKSHWDVPITINNSVLHIIAAHPTPPTFDGEEDRNGKRNHDEIRLISDFISNADYLYHDDGGKGGLKAKSRFVVLGDLNSSPDEGDSNRSAIQQLLAHPQVDSSCVPTSLAGKQNKADSDFAEQHTAYWGMRADYVIPSKFGLSVEKCGVFWPTKEDSLHRLVVDRKASSDHRLVWLDIVLE